MPLGALTELAAGFEGCEKKLEIDFPYVNELGQAIDLRRIPRNVWESVLADARCEIISVIRSRTHTAYLLSESSLFVSAHKVLLKTCGTTSLLHCLPKLLRAAEDACVVVPPEPGDKVAVASGDAAATGCDDVAFRGVRPEFVQFSRSNFLYPDVQPFPHRFFSMEVEYLNTFFSGGKAYIFGPINGPRWHLYVADLKRHELEDERRERTLEVVMFNLDPDVMRQFYSKSSAEPNGDGAVTAAEAQAGAELTQRLGIDGFVPGSTIDSFLFEPCGYSCNGLRERDDCYFTIHVTPEPQCSFVSFETNAPHEELREMVQRVLGVFRPHGFIMSLFVDANSSTPDSSAGDLWKCPDFELQGRTTQWFNGHYNATCAQYVTTLDGTRPAEYGSLSPTAVQETEQDKCAVVLDDNVARALSDPSWKSNLDSGFEHLHLEHPGLPYGLTRTMDPFRLAQVAAQVLRGKQIRVDECSDPGAEAGTTTSSLTAYQNTVARIVAAEDPEDAFCLVDLHQITLRFRLWVDLFPHVQPYCTAKGHCDLGILLALHSIGVGLGSLHSAQIRSLLLYGADPRHLLFKHPRKADSHIRYASEKRIGLVTFDSVDELEKIHRHYPTARVLLHLKAVGDQGEDEQTSEARTVAPLLRSVSSPELTTLPSNKSWPFSQSRSRHSGATVDDIPAILAAVQRLGVRLVGLCFDRENTVLTPTTLRQTLDVAASTLEQANQTLGCELSLVDLGGGFGPDIKHLRELASVLRLDALPAALQDVQLVAHPSSFLTMSSVSVALNVIGRRFIRPAPSCAPEAVEYFVNDGVHPFLSSASMSPSVMCLPVYVQDDEGRDVEPEGPLPSAIVGHGGVLAVRQELSHLDMGDWVLFSQLGLSAVGDAAFGLRDAPVTRFIVTPPL